MNVNQAIASSESTDGLPAPAFVKPTQPANTTSLRRSKRATLNFPIIPPQAAVGSQSQSHPSSVSPGVLPTCTPTLNANPTQHSSPPYTYNTLNAAPSPRDSSEFLTSLAAQERKVLEIREELQKAEAELLALKRQWAQYEAHKKRHEARHGERMEPLSLNHASKSGSGYNGVNKSADGEEAKSVRLSRRRTHQRVFSGSRHTRTLSLLSPTFEDRLRPRASSVDGNSRSNKFENGTSLRMPQDQSAAREDDMSDQIEKQLPSATSLHSPSRDTIVRTSKQVASDLREGLWTFFEDIRQATVGEEGINGTESRGIQISYKNKSECAITPQPKARDPTFTIDCLSPKQVLASPSKESSRTGDEISFWREFGLETPEEVHAKHDKATEIKSGPKASPLVHADDNWDTWDTPRSQTPLAHRSQKPGKAELTPLGAADVRTNVLPWPELKRYTPSKLTQTVTDLMKDWDGPSAGVSQFGKIVDQVDESKKVRIW